ncbi:hypothetical protein [Streptomyces rhizosphaerihabitans]|uniref:hypothetical protein n=1 Tax=Streptomyces rhizosphaerihabitans TaxID=1266770 RepID=UPI0021BE171B|nr:hypothetical protein [Streptomyces rhizosphaerihabitans]MCT9003538.1 hypothetical protein [Streptomyces rhizosphaerihabitans]
MAKPVPKRLSTACGFFEQTQVIITHELLTEMYVPDTAAQADRLRTLLTAAAEATQFAPRDWTPFLAPEEAGSSAYLKIVGREIRGASYIFVAHMDH